MSYDPANVFARILRGELPCKKVYEDAHVLAFHDIRPLAPVHVLVIPKGPYVSMDDFAAAAPPEMQAAFVAAIGKVARLMGVEGKGFRILANAGDDANQEVPHLHVHVFGGRPLGPMLKRAE
ncbi:MAG: histidine triad nucleotide-binding protein [Alphaproteobacteria bacterium]|nr:histidine triad nucleotide-binding protein [Alphaproteobacteria bacterium]